MALSDALIAEVNTAVDAAVVEQEKESTETGTSQTPAEPEASQPTVELGTEEIPEIAASETTKPSDDTPEAAGGQKTHAAPIVPVVQSKPALSDAALTQAVMAGIPIADARTFQSDEALLRVVSAVSQAVRSQNAKDAENTAQPADEDPFAALPNLDPEQYEPEVVKMFEAMKGILKQQQETIQSFKSSQDQISQAAQAQAAQEVEKWFDTQVRSLGDDFKEALGEGDYGALDRGGSQFAKRDAIATQMAVMLAGYNAAGIQSPPREVVFDAASRLVLRDEYQKIHEKKIAGELSKRSTQHIARAGGQGSKGKTNPFDDAAATLDEKYFARK